MDTYTVKQISEMLDTKPETVRRWIRNGKLDAEKTSRKEGHIVKDEDLKAFLKSSPKYAGIISGITSGAATAGLSAGVLATAPISFPLVAGFAVSSILAQKSKKKAIESLGQDEMKKYILYIQNESDRLVESIEQKRIMIEQLQDEIKRAEEQIGEIDLVLKQLRNQHE